MPCCGGAYLLTFLYLRDIIIIEVHDFPAEGKRWRLAFTLFVLKGVMIMTDYEILAIVLVIITLCFSIHNGNHKG